jgi:ABC-2 type transport system permease protein
MLKTELKLSFRDMNMPIFAICMPLLVTVIIGLIYGTKPAFEGASYSFMAQSFGALSAIAICAGGVMGLPLVVADYRQKKILKRLKVTPVSPALILAAHVAMYSLYSAASLVLVYGVSALFFGYAMAGSWGSFLLSWLLITLSTFSLGMMVGGLAPDMKTASLIASLLYFPQLVFSGMTLPYEIMPPVLRRAADFMPLTQGIKLLKATSLGVSPDGVIVPVAVMAICAAVCIAVSIKFFRWE